MKLISFGIIFTIGLVHASDETSIGNTTLYDAVTEHDLQMVSLLFI